MDGKTMVKMRRSARVSAAASSPSPGELHHEFARDEETGFWGFVYDPEDLTRRFVVELLLDGLPVRLARAECYVAELAAKGIGDACYGFSFALTPELVSDSRLAEVRLANDLGPIGASIRLNAAAEVMTDRRSLGAAEWMGGLRFRGWVRCQPTESPMVRAVVDGEPIAEARASGFSHVGGIDNADLVKAFDLHLPADYADGRVRRVHFITEDEWQLTVAPVAFVAFPDAVERFFASFSDTESDRLRGQMLDRLLPASAPFASYENWRKRWDESPSPIVTIDRPTAVALIAGGNEEISLESLDQQQHDNWVAAALPALDGPGSFDPDELRDFLAHDGSDAEIVVFAPAGTVFDQLALNGLAQGLATIPQARTAYCDLEISGEDARPWPLALPAFDYERMLEQGYCAQLFAMDRATVLAALAARPTNLYRLFNSQFDNGLPRHGQIVHVPVALGRMPPLDVVAHSHLLAKASLTHLAARGIAAETKAQRGALLPAAGVTRKSRPRTLTVIIPVRNRRDLLAACLSSIAPVLTKARARVLVVDNDSSDADMVDYLEILKRSGTDVLAVPGAFNFARLNNLAVAACDSDDVLLLNNDIRAMDTVWLAEMQGRLAEPDVGAVGALLLWPSGMIQHAGVTLGASFAAQHIGNDRLASDPGYGDMLRVARECGSVTAACLLTRRSDYLDAGGLDEMRFPVNFNDVDYCLTLRSRGKRVVWTPAARLYHHESASRGRDQIGDKAARFERELRNLRNKWGEHLLEDPYYNPNLSLDAVPFSALAWPPRGRDPRINRAPSAVELPPGF
ncbi:glycosyltransferase family 2 protein [Bradyrhizobium sp. BR 10261]|uniref:glycosyltransferase family 2 protein n=1 Tax=Bradyrhizobium sp. BR 10261 TaxID=2749992 RepID=UPI001C64FA1D|nr:glycosyltransferase [Bradyrhizobium sp. BR 10261]MBW7961816.1 glycosyltransferase [Bradyrhizobium sp. BR 10261]